MNEEQAKKNIDDTCDESKGDSIWSMARDFYSRKMLTTVIFVWVWAIIFFAGAAYCGIQFFTTDQTKFEIMYAAVFICCFNGIALMKIFAWQMLHRKSIKREINKLKQL